MSTNAFSQPKGSFQKRFYTPRALFRDLLTVLLRFPSILETSRSRRISRTFTEKIMLAVTSVNGCRYCWYGHARMALSAGVTAEEIEQILAHELGSFPPEQALALAFAQHYAESGGRPDPQALQRLQEAYGPQKAESILDYIRLITIGNLSGNAFDAFLSRLAGRPAPGSSILSEAFLFVLLAPVLVPLLLVMKAKRAG
jgi:AhpD family alkylhydroperoxidase